LVTSLRIPTHSGHLFRSIPAILQGDERNAGQFNQTPLLLPHLLHKLQGEIQNSQALPISKPIPSPPIPGERAGWGGFSRAFYAAFRLPWGFLPVNPRYVSVGPGARIFILD
jgi:hypothetical protein